MKIIPIILLALTLSNIGHAQMQPGFKDFDVAPGVASSAPIYLLAFDGKLYFYGSDGNSGRELHMVQGQGVPKLIKNINPTGQHSISTNYFKPLAGMGGKIYFTANNGTIGEEMFVYDGTNDPVPAFDLTLGPDSARPDNYTVIGNKLYFTATTASEGQELYVYDGTNSPSRLTDINTGSAGSVYGPMIAYNSKLYFVGNTPANGSELWQYDPLIDTATLIADIDSGQSSSNPANLSVINGKIYFSATTFAYGRELYVYDGNNSPTRLTDIYPGSISSLTPTHSNAFAWFNNKLYFTGRDTTGENHLYSYDQGNINLVHKVNPNGDAGPRDFMVYNGRLFFTVNDGANGYELYAYDGTNPPAIIGDLCAGANSSLPSELTVIGDELYFSANNCNNSGVDLFSYNHTRVGLRNVLFDAEVKIYPNPVEKNLHIDMTLLRDEQLRIRVADVAGRNIYDGTLLPYQAGKNKTDIPMRNMPSGNYIYYITNKQGTTYLTGKVLKQ